MTLSCPESDCDCAVTLINDNGVTDPAEGDRWEEYECARGHKFTKVLRA